MQRRNYFLQNVNVWEKEMSLLLPHCPSEVIAAKRRPKEKRKCWRSSKCKSKENV